jgi:hypothetical protein
VVAIAPDKRNTYWSAENKLPQRIYSASYTKLCIENINTWYHTRIIEEKVNI